MRFPTASWQLPGVESIRRLRWAKSALRALRQLAANDVVVNDMDVQGKSSPWTEGWVVRRKTVLLSSSARLNWLVASSHSHTHRDFPMERRSWINQPGPSAPSNTSNAFLPALVLLVFRTNHPKNSWLTGHDDLFQFGLTSLLPLACELQRDKRRFFTICINISAEQLY